MSIFKSDSFVYYCYSCVDFDKCVLLNFFMFMHWCWVYVHLQSCGESVTAVQGGCVGSAGFAEVLCCTYGGWNQHFCHKNTNISVVQNIMRVTRHDCGCCGYVLLGLIGYLLSIVCSSLAVICLCDSNMLLQLPAMGNPLITMLLVPNIKGRVSCPAETCRGL